MRILWVFIALFSLAACGQSGKRSAGSAESAGNEILYADPTVMEWEGKYYLTGTGTQSPAGFTVLQSEDLLHWSTGIPDSLRFILKKGEGTFGEKGFWAPQWFADNGRWFLAYTADEQVALASSSSWLGPFKQEKVQPVDSTAHNIDPYLFKDDDGKYYLYHVRFNKGNYIWVAEFDMKSGRILPQTLKQCLDCTEEWENTHNYPSDPIMEGPTVKKWGDVYYLFYSANHFMNIDYAVGYATSSSPFGPWKKYEGNPIIHRSIVKENGSGHGDIFATPEGDLYYVYHVHNSDSVVSPRRTRIVPMLREKGADGIYHISVDSGRIIKPLQTIQ